MKHEKCPPLTSGLNSKFRLGLQNDFDIENHKNITLSKILIIQKDIEIKK